MFEIPIGFIINLFTKINNRCLSSYKTYAAKKKNPNIYKIGSKVELRGNISIGDNTYINGGRFQALENSKIIIGKDCMISHDVIMRTDTHLHDNTTKPMIKRGHIYKNITIGDNVWIGEGAYIMPGIIVGDGAIIGAHAVVTKNVDSNTVVAGVPAKVIKKR